MKTVSAGIAALLLLAACGDDGDGTLVGGRRTDQDTPATTGAPATTDTPATMPAPPTTETPVDTTDADVDGPPDDTASPDLDEYSPDETEAEAIVADMQIRLGVDEAAATSFVDSMGMTCSSLAMTPAGADAYFDGYFSVANDPTFSATFLSIEIEHLCPEHTDTLDSYLAANNLDTY